MDEIFFFFQVYVAVTIQEALFILREIAYDG